METMRMMMLSPSYCFELVTSLIILLLRDGSSSTGTIVVSSSTARIGVVDAYSVLPPPASVWRRRPPNIATTVPVAALQGWVQRDDGEWDWEDDQDARDRAPAATTTTATATTAAPATPGVVGASAAPQLPSGTYRPKQSLGQNYLQDGNTVMKIINSFHQDATTALRRLYPANSEVSDTADNTDGLDHGQVIELGPGAGALTDKLVESYGADAIQCIEIDDRSVDILEDKHGADLRIYHQDVLQVDYYELAVAAMAASASASSSATLTMDGEGDFMRKPLVVIGNLPYYITSQILFCLADTCHHYTDDDDDEQWDQPTQQEDSFTTPSEKEPPNLSTIPIVASATVTMQWEVACRIVAQPSTKDYGILSVVFQIYALEQPTLHYKIPPTVFYPKPKVDSALVGIQFCSPQQLHDRLNGVRPEQLRTVVTTAFQQRRKVLRNSLKRMVQKEICLGDKELATRIFDSRPNDMDVAVDERLPSQWATLRPEELTPRQFIALTRHIYSFATAPGKTPMSTKVWRKAKHGKD